ncbi:hypothetical protein HZY91_04810 [Facklamia sp. DSM 111018]|uniref:Uncharacterized protein n=1 Tax=Facklamia lactis TaxID=2749967 RepID=A0ABS0LQ61_9LACT|nr:hypothetical protein [Facklamia lactis]MBG9986213.1 hypothetical protein [Facklamia lactis]
MLATMRKNKNYIFGVLTLGLFGLMGLLIVFVVRGIIKLANHYPRTFRRISFILFIILCIYGFLFSKDWNIMFFIMCIAITLDFSDMNNRGRE